MNMHRVRECQQNMQGVQDNVCQTKVDREHSCPGVGSMSHRGRRDTDAEVIQPNVLIVAASRLAHLPPIVKAFV